MSLPRGKKFQVQPIEGVWHCLFWCNPRVPHDWSDALASVPADLSVLLPFIFIQLYVCHCLKMMFQCFSWKVCPMTSPKLQCAKSCEFQRCLSSSCWSGINTFYKLDRKGAKEKRYKIKKKYIVLCRNSGWYLDAATLYFYIDNCFVFFCISPWLQIARASADCFLTSTAFLKVFLFSQKLLNKITWSYGVSRKASQSSCPFGTRAVVEPCRARGCPSWRLIRTLRLPSLYFIKFLPGLSRSHLDPPSHGCCNQGCPQPSVLQPAPPC